MIHLIFAILGLMVVTSTAVASPSVGQTFYCQDKVTSTSLGRIEVQALDSDSMTLLYFSTLGSSEGWELRLNKNGNLYNADPMVQHGQQFIVGKARLSESETLMDVQLKQGELKKMNCILGLGLQAQATTNTYAPTLKSIVVLFEAMDQEYSPFLFQSLLGEMMEVKMDESCAQVRVSADRTVNCISKSNVVTAIGKIGQKVGQDGPWIAYSIDWFSNVRIVGSNNNSRVQVIP